MANKLSVAFIGTGIMGAPIAGHILDAGYPVTVNTRTKSKAAALIERGAVWADTPADAEKDGDWLEAAIRKEEGCADVTIIRSSVGPTIGSHVGPGMVACAFWGKNRADKASLSDRIARRVRGQ